MSTNFYARHIPTESEYHEMQKLLTNRQLGTLRHVLNQHLGEFHIGKRSYGWAFSFQARAISGSDEEAKVPWEDNLESLKEYLNREDVQIVNEYGVEFTPEQFWNEEVGECLRVVPGKYDSHETYNEHHPDRLYRPDPNEKVKDGIRWTYCWFC